MSTHQKIDFYNKKYNDVNTEVIAQTYEKLQSLLENLNHLHNCVIQTYEKDFVTAYKDHMIKVQCELIHIKKKSSEHYLKMQKDERVKFLESTISWFRDEAMKLAQNIQLLQQNNKELKA